jgi:hypothetical protein
MPHDIAFDPPTMFLEFDPESDPKSPLVSACYHEFANGVFKVFVPKGFRSDLASVPNCLLWLVDPLGKHQRAALFHDVAYRLQYCTRYTADAIFRVILERDQVPAWRVFLLYYAVRMFGGRAWKQNRQHVDKTRRHMRSRCE